MAILETKLQFSRQNGHSRDKIFSKLSFLLGGLKMPQIFDWKIMTLSESKNNYFKVMELNEINQTFSKLFLARKLEMNLKYLI